MAINLITKYGSTLDKGFGAKSLTAGKASTRYTWDGAQGIKVLHTLPAPLNDYNQSASSNRFGTPTDVQDALQYMKIRKMKSYSNIIDATHNSMQDMLKSAGAWMKQQDEEVVIPYVDAYNLNEWAHNAGQNVSVASVSKTTIIEALLDMEVALNNKRVPKNMRWTYVPETSMKYIRLASEWNGCDGLVTKVLANGHVGNFSTLQLVPVPDADMPANCYALAARQGSVFAPTKLSIARIHRTPQGYAGHLMEALRVFDAFVDYAQCDGVVALIKSSEKETAPTVSVAGQITVASGKTVKYTLDGTDPRYSDSAVTITSTATPTHTAGDTIKAIVCGSSAGSYQSDITTTVTTS